MIWRRGWTYGFGEGDKEVGACSEGVSCSRSEDVRVLSSSGSDEGRDDSDKLHFVIRSSESGKSKQGNPREGCKDRIKSEELGVDFRRKPAFYTLTPITQHVRL